MASGTSNIVYTEFQYMEGVLRVERSLFVDFRQDAITLASFIIEHVPSGTYDELKNILAEWEASNLSWNEFVAAPEIASEKAQAKDAN